MDGFSKHSFLAVLKLFYFNLFIWERNDGVFPFHVNRQLEWNKMAMFLNEAYSYKQGLGLLLCSLVELLYSHPRYPLLSKGR